MSDTTCSAVPLIRGAVARSHCGLIGRMIEARVRGRIDRFVDPIGAFLARLGLTPVAVTLMGLAVTIGGAVLIGREALVVGALVALAGATLDGLDGSVARARGSASPRGAFLDSVADRIGESALWSGIAFAVADRPRLVALCVVCVSGALTTSYLRAKAESVGADGRGGLMGRAERTILATAGLVTGFVEPMIWIMAFLVWVTVGQRFWLVFQRTPDSA